MIKISKEFKEAIIDMPQNDKDKLLIRLISKHTDIANQLYFQLMKGENSIEDEKQEVLDFLIRRGKSYPKYFYSPGYLLLEMRECSGKINHYKKITKDKVGEILLQLTMLQCLLTPNMDLILSTTPQKRLTLTTYVIKRLSKISKLMEHIHEDYYIEFKPIMLEVGQLALLLDPNRKLIDENNVDMENYLLDD